MEKKANIELLIIPDTPFPPNRPMLLSMWNREFTRGSNRITWVMQSDFPESQPRSIRNWNDSEVLFVKRNEKSSLLLALAGIIKYCFDLIRTTRKILASKRIDIIHAHDGYLEGLIAYFMAKLHFKYFSFAYTSQFIDTKLAAYERNANKSYGGILSNKLMKIVYVFLFRNADLIFPISAPLGNEISLEYGVSKNRIFPVYECASNRFLRYEGKIRECPTNQIVYTGEISVVRELNFLLSCFKKVLERKDAQLLILGTGKSEELEKLKLSAKKLNIDKKVIFHEKVPYMEVPSVISGSFIGVSPIPPRDFFINSTPTKVIEYLALGIPVVANTEIIDQEKIIEKSGGGIGVKYSEQQFANALIWLLNNPEHAKKMGDKGRKWIINNRTNEKMAQLIEDRYMQLLSGETNA